MHVAVNKYFLQKIYKTLWKSGSIFKPIKQKKGKILEIHILFCQYARKPIYHCFGFKTSIKFLFVDRFLIKRQIMFKFISLPPVLDGSKSGKMAWKIDLSNSKYNVKSVELLVQSKIYENGKIIWQLLGDSKALLPTPGKFMIMINLIHSLL